MDTVIPNADTIVNKTIDEVPIRKQLYLGQTPQSFKLSLIKEAHEEGYGNILDSTDDCQLVLKLGKEVHLVEGEN